MQNKFIMHIVKKQSVAGKNTPGTDADRIQTEIYKRMTPDERWQQALRLNAAARELKAAGLRSQHPDWSEKKIQDEVRKIFLYAAT